jgi:hypothetical protein
MTTPFLLGAGMLMNIQPTEDKQAIQVVGFRTVPDGSRGEAELSGRVHTVTPFAYRVLAAAHRTSCAAS